ncbi:unnamed protein product [Prorocentrum cordatum]|uniref:Cyclic nucleotide-binding domain-containing protein n=1 Tax=Prorocentrum cordatum TaxID=2364126 RepID=A0ABN9V7B2_9DINO|nr:unnamed protein product [Polarella glacialis]
MAPVIENLTEDVQQAQSEGHQPRRASMGSTTSSLASAVSSVASLTTGWRRRVQSVRLSWQRFSFFGVNSNDDTPRVWGSRVRSSTRRTSDDSSADGSSLRPARRRRSNELLRVVREHTYHEEMRLQLRDERVRLSYLDAFEMDSEPGAADRMVRVFSIGATLLEYVKILLGVWAFFLALAVAAFQELASGLGHVDLVIDLAYAAFLIVQLHTTILHVETGRESCSAKRILLYNLRDPRFWMDVVSCVPLVLLESLSAGGPGTEGVARWGALLKALRGWRITRTPPEHRFVPSVRFVLLQLAGAMLMGGHLLACVWFMLVREEEKTITQHFPEDYMPEGYTESDFDFWRLYVLSLNQGVYLLLGIDRDAYGPLELAFVTLCAPVGVLVHAFVFGKVVLLIQRMGALETKQNEHTRSVQEAMRILGLPANLQMRLVAFFTYERIHRSARLFNALFADLSPQLRFELQLHLYLDLVGKSGLFRKARPRVIREIIVKLEDVIFLPGDWICRYGDYGDSMYFIMRGRCAVLDKDTVTELKTLERGAYFGEVALLTGVPRTAYVRANSFCIMAQLTKERFEPIVKKWPEEIDVLISGVERLADREQIKKEASRHYGIRRMSQMSLGGGSVCDNAPCGGGGRSARAARRLSDVSLSSSGSALMGSGSGVGLSALLAQQPRGPAPHLRRSLSDLGPEGGPPRAGGAPPPLGPDASAAAAAAQRAASALLPAAPASLLPLPPAAQGAPLPEPAAEAGPPRPTLLAGQGPAARLEAEGAALGRLKKQLADATGQIEHLRGELEGQRRHLQEGLSELGRWTAEAVRDAVLREVMEDDPDGDDIDGRSGDGARDDGMGISTPFT